MAAVMCRFCRMNLHTGTPVAPERPVLNPPKPSNGAAVAGMILGIVGLVLFYATPNVALVIAVLGAILSAVGSRKAKRLGIGGGKATAGAVLSIVAIGLAILQSAVWSYDPRTSTFSKPEAGLTMPAIGKEVVTYTKYERIQNGMSYKEVVAIIGVEGREMSRNKMDGAPGVMESLVTVMYGWQNQGGSNMNAIFQNDKLVQKAQFGLR